jgi:ABC-type transport system substrate-binding protein
MRTASGFRAACLALGLALLGSGCLIPQRDAGGNGVRGGTLQVLSGGDIIGMDTAINYTPEGLAIARTYARTLYGYNLAGPPEQQTVPVPDIASSYQLAADQRTYTFTLRPGVRYAPPVNREVTARDFITAIERFYDQQNPSPGQQYADLIVGAEAFAAGKAERISGLAAPDPHTPADHPGPAGRRLPVDPHPVVLRSGAGRVRSPLWGLRLVILPGVRG